jgi:hypothetical protein
VKHILFGFFYLRAIKKWGVREREGAEKRRKMRKWRCLRSFEGKIKMK